MQISVVVGNPKPNSRTLTVAETVAVAVAELTGSGPSNTVDLVTVAGQLFEWPNEQLTELNDMVAASDIVVFASPTYKASFTGLLKAFLDRYANLALESVVAIPVMTGAAPQHALAPDVQLRPVLIELGASVPTSALYFEMTQMAELDAIVAKWADRNATVLRTLAAGARSGAQS